MNKPVFLVFLLWSSISAHAGAIGEKLPSNFSQLQFKQVGNATFSVLFWDIYNSSLYTKSGTYSQALSQDVIFEINYLKDITSEDLIERTVEQWQHLKNPKVLYQAFIPTLATIWPNITAGDTLTLVVQQQKSVFYFNGKKVGSIEEKNFSSLFLSIWLSPNTSQLALRAQLLGEL